MSSSKMKKTQVQKRLKEIVVLAKQKGLTRYAACKLAEVDPIQFYKWQAGWHEPRISTLERIENALKKYKIT